jgi:hypothetical protein
VHGRSLRFAPTAGVDDMTQRRAGIDIAPEKILRPERFGA